MTPPILSVRDLTVSLDEGRTVRALVDRVSFDVAPGEILGVVGESGSGKSLTCRAIMRLLPGVRLAISGGRIDLAGVGDLTGFDERAMHRVRGREIGMIFQNPSSHLDPVMTIGGQIAESVRYHHNVPKAEARRRARDLLQQVGIPDSARRMDSYPHEYSGGMRQRAMIAAALACEPKILIADEPTTALDVTVQAQILRLLVDLRDRRGLSIIFITHDLGVVSQLCDTVAVMYAGRLCEYGPKQEIIRRPRHNYTAGLIACQPSGGRGEGRVRTIAGQPPGTADMPDGCRFHPRCDRTLDVCRSRQPAMEQLKPDHTVACHNPISADGRVHVDETC